MSPVVRHGLHDAPVPRAAASVRHQPEQHAGPAGDTADARLPLPGLLLPLLTTADGDLVAARKQDRHRQGSVSARLHSVPARHISEGAAPCPYCLAPCPIIQHPARIFFFFLQYLIAVFVFSDKGVKMLVKCLQICAHVFIDRPQNCAQTSFRSCTGLRPNFGHSRSKLCPIMCRSRTKLCPNSGRPRARLCPISFAPCLFPNLAGTLLHTYS